MKTSTPLGIFTPTLLVIISIGNFLRYISLGIPASRQSNLCSNSSCACTYFKNGGPYIAAGPSKLQELVPMAVLKEHVVLDSVEGLRHLDHVSLSRYFQCKPSMRTKKIHWCKKRRFMKKKLPLVALVSFHGSGNTWLRYLLEQSTGVFTGSIYCDKILKATFPGESVVSKNVIAVKTHHADSRSLPKDVQISMKKELYDKAIVLVRDPYDAILSEANRRWNSNTNVNNHIGLASEASFIGNSKWDWYVEYNGAEWAYFIHTWLSQNDTDVILVQYEKLVDNLKEELPKILAFLNFDISNASVECAIKNSLGIYKRPHHLNFNPYSEENCNTINRFMHQALPILSNYNVTYNSR